MGAPNSGVVSKRGHMPWRIQSEHSRSIDFGEVDDDDDAPDLHTVVEQLAGVVRNLATTVREEPANVKMLREVVETDHAALQSHIQEAREDRKVMMKLLSVIAEKSGGAESGT